MSLKLNERYPGRFDNPSSQYPQGAFKNRSAPGVLDGSYLEKDWANDKEGFFQSLLAAANIVPNGVVDSVGASQYYSALLQIINSTSPTYPGEVSTFAMESAPDGWLKANGAAVSRTVYEKLFTAIGTRFGVGNGTTTFNLPDLRGEFVRGFDDGRGVDTGRVLGSTQEGTTHAYAQGSSTGSGATGSRWSDDLTSYGIANKEQREVRTVSTGGPIFPAGTIYQNDPSNTYIATFKSRPRNMALLYCIKY